MPNLRRVPEFARGAVRLRRFPASVGRASKIHRIPAGKIELGDRISIGSRASLTVHGKLVLGDRVRIGNGAEITATLAVRIGARSEVSWNVKILDNDFHQITEDDGSQRPMSAPITIGEHVLIGAYSMILKGVTIGDGAVIGAGSVVTRDIRPGWIAAGNPAREIRHVSDWV